MLPPVWMTATRSPLHGSAFGEQSGKSDRACWLRRVVRRAEESAHRLRSGVVAHGYDAGGTGVDQRDSSLVRHAAGHAVDERVSGLGGDDLPDVERSGVRRRSLGDDSHNVGVETEQVAHPNEPADSGPHAHRHIDDVEVADSLEQLGGVGRHAENQIGVVRRTPCERQAPGGVSQWVT